MPSQNAPAGHAHMHTTTDRKAAHMKAARAEPELSDVALRRWGAANVAGGHSHAAMAAFLQSGLDKNTKSRRTVLKPKRCRGLSHHAHAPAPPTHNGAGPAGPASAGESAAGGLPRAARTPRRRVKYTLVSGHDSITVPEGVRVTFNAETGIDAFLKKFEVFAASEASLCLVLHGGGVVATLGSPSTFAADAHARLAAGTGTNTIVVALAGAHGAC